MQRNRDAVALAYRGDYRGRGDRITPERGEVGLRGDGWELQRRRPQRRDRLLELRGGGGVTVGRRAQVTRLADGRLADGRLAGGGSRQLPAVDLGVSGQRQVLVPDEIGWDHVVGQVDTQFFAQ